MSRPMLTTWSPEYIQALFSSDKANDPIFGRFTSREGRDGFVARGKILAGRFPGLEVTPLSDDRGVRIKGARADNLLEVVKAAQQLGGEILFPGALPA